MNTRRVVHRAQKRDSHVYALLVSLHDRASERCINSAYTADDTEMALAMWTYDVQS